MRWIIIWIAPPQNNISCCYYDLDTGNKEDTMSNLLQKNPSGIIPFLEDCKVIVSGRLVGSLDKFTLCCEVVSYKGVWLHQSYSHVRKRKQTENLIQTRSQSLTTGGVVWWAAASVICVSVPLSQIVRIHKRIAKFGYAKVSRIVRSKVLK